MTYTLFDIAQWAIDREFADISEARRHELRVELTRRIEAGSRDFVNAWHGQLPRREQAFLHWVVQSGLMAIEGLKGE